MREYECPLYYLASKHTRGRCGRNAKFRFITEYRSSARTFGLCAKRNIFDRCLRYISRPESRPHRPSRTLRSLYRQVLIPSAVYRELTDSKRDLPRAIDLASIPWLIVVAAANHKRVRELRGILDPGEAEAIVVAIEHRADVLLVDERRGRRTAPAAGLTGTGLIGVVAQGKRVGLLDLAKPVLDELVHTARFWIGPELYSEVLAELGETSTQHPASSTAAGSTAPQGLQPRHVHRPIPGTHRQHRPAAVQFSANRVLADASLRRQRQIHRDPPVSGVCVQVRGEAVRQPQRNPTIAGMYHPTGGHVRYRSHLRLDVAIPAAQVQPAKLPAHVDVAVAAARFQRAIVPPAVDVAVAAARFQRAIESLAVDVAVMRHQPGLPAQAIGADVAIARVHVGLGRVGNLHFDLHPPVSQIEMQCRDLHFDLHPVAGLMIHHVHVARADPPAGGVDPR